MEGVQRLPQVSGRKPLIGHLPQLRRDPLGLLMRAGRLGDVTSIDLGPRGPAHLVSHPDGVKHVLLDNYENYSKKTRGFDLLRTFLGDGLLTSEGDFWRKQRRIAQPAFHHKQLRRFSETMARAGVELGDRWASAAKSGVAFDVADDMMEVTLKVVGQCLFSTDPSESSSEFGEYIRILLEKFIPRISAAIPWPLQLPLPSHREFHRAIHGFRRLVDEIVVSRRRRGPSENPDLLDLLMEVRDEETGEGMSDVQVRDEALTLLLAGHETTAATLSWTWAVLSLHPEIDRRLGESLSEISAPVIGFEQLGELGPAKQVILEVMRLFPPAWTVGRRVEKDDTIGGAPIRAGGFVFLSPYVTHRRPDVFPNPEGFDPSRHSVEPRVVNGGHSRYAYFPFGAGPRICIGNEFALMETQLLLANLRRRFRLSLVPGSRITPLPQLTLRPHHGVPVTATPA